MSNQEDKKAKSLRAFKDLIKIRSRIEKKTPLEVLREIEYEEDQRKAEKPKNREAYFDNPKFRARLSEKNSQLRKEMEERHRKMSQGQNPYEES